MNTKNKKNKRHLKITIIIIHVLHVFIFSFPQLFWLVRRQEFLNARLCLVISVGDISNEFQFLQIATICKKKDFMNFINFFCVIFYFSNSL